MTDFTYLIDIATNKTMVMFHCKLDIKVDDVLRIAQFEFHVKSIANQGNVQLVKCQVVVNDAWRI